MKRLVGELAFNLDPP